jgi:hypothetical protein
MGLLEPFAFRRVADAAVGPGLPAEDAHEIEREIVLLARQGAHQERPLRVDVVPQRPHAMRHGVADHPPHHPLFVIRVEVLEDDLPHRLDPLAAIVGQRREVVLDGGGGASH